MTKEEAVRRHQLLVDQGWIRRFTAEEPRLSEMKSSYESLGLEVRVEPGMLGDEESCNVCFTAPGFEDRYKTIYTRGQESGNTSETDELFE